jgi:hypothetical protein
VLPGPLFPTLSHTLPHRKGYAIPARHWLPLGRARSKYRVRHLARCSRQPYSGASSDRRERRQLRQSASATPLGSAPPSVGRATIGRRAPFATVTALPCPRFPVTLTAGGGWRRTLPTLGGVAHADQGHRWARAGRLRRGARSSRSQSHGASRAGNRHAHRARWWPPRRKPRRGQARPRESSPTPNRT